LFQVQFVDERMEPRTGLSYVAVYDAGTTTASTIKAERSGDTAVTNPMTLSSTASGLRPSNGLVQFYSTKTTVDIVAQVGGREVSFKGVRPTDRYFQVPYNMRRGSVRDGKGGYFLFNQVPSITESIGTAGVVTDAHINFWTFNQGRLEANNIAEQTLFLPTFSSAGLQVAGDQTDNNGREITQGVVAGGPAAFTVGTDGPFYFKLKFSIAVVAGTDDCLVGFRGVQAYSGAAAVVENYDDMAALNVISGDIYIETIKDDAATDSDDTTNNWANAATHTLEVYVSQAGVVTYKIDGVAPVTTQAFSFTTGDVVVPFFYLLHANASQAGAVALIEWDCGLDD